MLHSHYRIFALNCAGYSVVYVHRFYFDVKAVLNGELHSAAVMAALAVLEGIVPVGIALEGIVLEGTVPVGIVLEGTVPAGIVLEGTVPAGIALEGTVPAGIVLEGTAPVDIALEGIVPVVFEHFYCFYVPPEAP